VLGDLTKAQYVMRRQAVQDELERLAPPADPQLAEAENLLANFGSFWDREDSPAERHRLLVTLFESVWQVKPRSAFVPYFLVLAENPKSQSGFSGVQSGSDGTRTRGLRRDRSDDRRPCYPRIPSIQAKKWLLRRRLTSAQRPSICGLS
jgi:hypothetical protein